MRKQGRTIAITSILFESNDIEALIKGNVSHGVMNYDTDLVVSHSQLNIIFNSLQKQNQEISVNDFLKSEKMYDGETLYSANFSELSNNKISFYDIEGNQPLRQIRA